MTAGGFPHSEILGSKPCWRLPEAYRSLTRPSSVLSAKASTKRPSRTTRHTRAATRQSQQIHRTTDLRTNDRKTIERSPTPQGREPRNHNKANQDNPKKTNGRPVRSRPLSSSQTTTHPDEPKPRIPKDTGRPPGPPTPRHGRGPGTQKHVPHHSEKQNRPDPSTPAPPPITRSA